MPNLLKSIPRKLVVLLLVICITTLGYAQQPINIFDNSQPVNPGRYDDIEGSPYLYKNWVPAKIIATNGQVYPLKQINFNGLTSQIEFKEDGVISEILPTSYLKIIAITENGEDIFLRGIHTEFMASIICIPYDGQRVKLLKLFTVRKQESEIEARMKPSAYEKFISSSDYYLMVDGDLTPLKLKKKYIIEAIGQKTKVDTFIKKNKISLKTELGLVKLLDFYESDLL